MQLHFSYLTSFTTAALASMRLARILRGGCSFELSVINDSLVITKFTLKDFSLGAFLLSLNSSNFLVPSQNIRISNNLVGFIATSFAFAVSYPKMPYSGLSKISI
ncbi:MAG: hypothetical protein HUK21_01680 [Fibrobacteraceae bacterium]|nr:hypothetical protein [Fibrobacteraceae bacterium]